jgi:hypothetical protein
MKLSHSTASKKAMKSEGAAVDTTVSSHRTSHEAASPAASTAPQPPPTPTSLAARVTSAVALIEQAKALLDLGEPSSVEQVRRSVKFKKGGEQHVPTLALLSARFGVEVPSRPTADMKAQLQ